MNIRDFLKKNPVNPQEEQICKNIYGGLDLTEQDWNNKLQNSVTFFPKKEVVEKPTEEKVTDHEATQTEKEVNSNKPKRK
jgi:hypothetical protein